MHEDRTLFGQGRYPDTGPLAVLARLSFLVAVVAIVIAVFLPPWMVPRFVRSHYLEHFAAFYVALLMALAAMPRTQLRRIAIGFGVFATVLEGSHLPAGAQQIIVTAAQGNGGQKIYIAPQYHLVAVFTGGGYNDATSPNTIMEKVILPRLMEPAHRATTSAQK